MKQLEQPVNDARYYKHALPGGMNYREMLFTLPDIEGPDSLHWEEENVIAHVRLQDFTDTDGNLVLFVDEIQSDWHEQGREKGYSPVANKAAKDKARLRLLIKKPFLL